MIDQLILLICINIINGGRLKKENTKKKKKHITFKLYTNNKINIYLININTKNNNIYKKSLIDIKSILYMWLIKNEIFLHKINSKINTKI